MEKIKRNFRQEFSEDNRYGFKMENGEYIVYGSKRFFREDFRRTDYSKCAYCGSEDAKERLATSETELDYEGSDGSHNYFSKHFNLGAIPCCDSCIETQRQLLDFSDILLFKASIILQIFLFLIIPVSISYILFPGKLWVLAEGVRFKEILDGYHHFLQPGG